jgi:hypothetical protein
MMKHLSAALAGAAMLASAIGAISAPADAAPTFGIYFGLPGIYSAPPPNPSCWRWSHFQQQWVWTCVGPRPNWWWDTKHRRWYKHR